MQIDFTPLGYEHLSILRHTRKNGLYCGDSEFMQELIRQELMEPAGRKSFVPDPYFKLTDKGRDLIETTQRLIN